METDKNNQNPFAYRDSGGGFKVGGDSTDGDAITDMFILDSRMVCILKHSIHAIVLADAVDPDRKNPAIRNTQQSLLNYGSDDPIVGRTLAQALALFKNPIFMDESQVQSVIKVAFDFMEDISNARDELENYIMLESKANASFSGKAQPDGSVLLPSISNLNQIARDFIKKVDHAAFRIHDLFGVFFSIGGKEWTNQLAEAIIKSKLNMATEAAQFLKSIRVPLWQLRNIRNADEHPKPAEFVKIESYHFSTDDASMVISPTIECVHPKTPLSKMPLTNFMNTAMNNLLVIFEDACAIIATLHIKPNGPFTNTAVVIVRSSDRFQGKENTRYGYQFFLEAPTDTNKLVPNSGH